MSMTYRGRPPARFAVLKGMRQGITAKETAYAYGYSICAVQMAAARMKQIGRAHV